MDGLAKIILILQALMGNGGEEPKSPDLGTSRQSITCQSFSSTSSYKHTVNGKVIVDTKTASAGQTPCSDRGFGEDTI